MHFRQFKLILLGFICRNLSPEFPPGGSLSSPECGVLLRVGRRLSA